MLIDCTLLSSLPTETNSLVKKYEVGFHPSLTVYSFPITDYARIFKIVPHPTTFCRFLPVGLSSLQRKINIQSVNSLIFVRGRWRSQPDKISAPDRKQRRRLGTTY